MPLGLLLRATLVCVVFFMTGFVGAESITEGYSAQVIEGAALSERLGSVKQTGGHVKSSDKSSSLHQQSVRHNLKSRSTSSRLVEKGRCTDGRCYKSWPSADIKADSLIPGPVIVPEAIFQPAENTGEEFSLSAQWRAPAPESGLMPHHISYYQVLLDYGEHYRIYKVDERMVASAESGHKRVRQWLHVSSVGSERPRVFVRPISQVAGDYSGELNPSSEKSGLPQSKPKVIKKPALVGDIRFSDHNLAMCVLQEAHSGKTTPSSDLTVLRCPGRAISDLKGIEHLGALKALYLGKNPIQFIDNIASIAGLEVVDLSGTNVHDFSVLRSENFPWLREVYLKSTALSDLSNMAQLEFLEILAVPRTTVQVIPDFSATALRELDVSSSFIADLSGLSDVHTLQNLTFHGRDSNEPILHGNSHGQSSGDLKPLIDLASRPDNRLALIDLTNQQNFICPQLSALDEALQDYGSHEGELIAPESCLDLPVLSAPVSSSTPSTGNLYTISWESEGSIEAPLYQLQELPLAYQPDTENIIIDSDETEVDFTYLPPRKAGKYHYRVRACLTDKLPKICTPWSQSVEQAVAGLSAVPGDEAIANTDDPGLKSCLYDHLAYYADGALLYRSTGEITSLSCQGYQIVSLGGLQQFPNLRALNFHNNKIEDLAPLQQVLESTKQNGWGWRISLAENLVQGAELEVFSGYDIDIESLSLSDNPLGNIEGLGSLSSVESLNLARTEISNLNPLQDVSIGSLNISGNNISTVPGLSIQHELRASDNELSNILSLIGLFEASPNLKLIDLSGNSIGPIIGIGPSNNFDQLSFDSLQELYIQRTGFRNVHFVPLMNNLKKLDVSFNPISNLSGLHEHPALEELVANNTEISSVADLGNIASLKKLSLLETSISSLSPLAALSQLELFEISGGDLSAPDALAPLAGLPNLSELVIYDSSVSSALPIAEWLDDSANGFENDNSQSRIDLLREPGPTCREVRKIWEKGLLFSLDSETDEGVCRPDRLDIHIEQDELSGSYIVSWLPSIPPENYTGTSYYEISYQESGSSNSFLETVPDAFSGGMSLDINLSDGHDELVFRGRACRDDGVCSEWSDGSYPVYPLQRPYGVTFDPATKRLEWNYESGHSFETGEGIFFEVSPLFPVFEPVVVEAAGSSAWGYTVESPEDWPGRVATVRACREVSPEDTDCGPGVEIRMELVVVDETIPAPQSVSLSGRGGAGGKYSLSWQPVDNERVTHYKVRETVNSNQGQRQNYFAVEADRFDIYRFAADSSADYEVAACQKDRERGDRKSTRLNSSHVAIS